MRHHHFAACQLQALLHGGVGDVLRADGAEQFAFVACFGEDGQYLAGQRGGAAFGVCQFFRLLAFQLGAAGFKALDVRLGGFGRLALRDEEVAGIASLDFNAVAQVAEVGDFSRRITFMNPP